MLVHRNEID